MIARNLDRTLAAVAFAAFAFAGGTRIARAGDTGDLVLLAGGGRLRGVVLEESASIVTIKLGDGTVRTLQRYRVSQIQYGQAASAPPVGALPVVAPVYPTPVPVAPAPAWRFAPEGENALAPTPPLPAPRRSKALMVTGIVLMPLGALTLSLGAAACSISSSAGAGCPNPQLGGSDVALMAIGSATLVTGIVFTAVGASRRPLPASADTVSTDRPPPLSLQVAAGPRSVSLVGLF